MKELFSLNLHPNGILQYGKLSHHQFIFNPLVYATSFQRHLLLFNCASAPVVKPIVPVDPIPLALIV